MEAAFVLKHENPKKKANILSKLFFIWTMKLFYTGTKRPLKLHDLYKTLDCDQSEGLGDELQRKWKEEILQAKEKNRNPSLLKAVTRTFWKKYIPHGIFVFVMLIFLRSPLPLVLSWLIDQFEDGRAVDRTSLYASAGLLVAISITVIFFFHHIMLSQSCLGMRVRIALSSLVYRKILKLNRKSQGQTAAGQIVNLLSNDMQRFDHVCIYLHYLWVMPFQVALVTYFLWNTVGISCLAGILSMSLCTLPLQSYLGKLASSLRLKVAQRTDARVKLMSEIISGIQVIKMYAWEKSFEKLIRLLRCREVSVLTKSSYLRGFYLSCMVFIERSTLCLTLVCFTLMGNHIKADIVFSLAQFFNILQSAMAIMYPLAISIGAEALVSVKRLEDFLILEEKGDVSVERLKEPEVVLKNVDASWMPDNTILNKLNLSVPGGCLCAVVGPVGAGKTSLLQLILGELPPTAGSIKLGGDISYASQEPWLFSGSVKMNILFGKPFDQALYKEVTKVCALQRDFEQFPHGDHTMVGERGVSLSGGQRARINLARAIYRQADVYLLDDPLSAVDTHVGKHLFEECIINFLKGKTRILVTHQLQFLKKADLIVVLNEGHIEAVGTFKELSNSNLDFTKRLVSSDESQEDKEKDKHEQDRSIERSQDIVRKLSIKQSPLDEAVADQSIQEGAELESSGSTDQNSFWDYIKSVGNGCFVVVVILAFFLAQALCTGADLWVAIWTSQEERRYLDSAHAADQVQIYLLQNSTLDLNKTLYANSENPPTFLESLFDKIEIGGTVYTFVKTNVALYIYGGLIVLAILLTVTRSFLFFKAAMKASKNIHSKMFHSLLQVPMRFFDINPSGRVLNRFSKDVGAIDEILPKVLMESVQILLVMVGILVNVTISNYYMLAAIVLLGGVFLKLRAWHAASAKEIKHLEGIAKSPVFSHINSSLNGLATIRASQAEKILTKEFDEHQNVHTSAWVMTLLCTISFGLWLDIICGIFVMFVTFGFVISRDYGYPQNGSLVGLAISQSLILTGMLQYGMKQTAETINQLTSVERVLQYTKLDNEGPFETAEGKLPLMPWPCFGKIEFKNLSLSYVLGDDPVLKNLNVVIKSGEKVGIVGRTGAGKSSLISALFRLAPTRGQILIDGLDTTLVGLNDLRRNISIIPQEPVLFSATLRYNLDPFDEYEDDKLWAALEEVELKDLVTSLNFQVSEGGSNFSLGQRQLLCLARALLRNNKILVLDEATANVDARTDSLIQVTIRKKFKKCTVLTIAHRLNTIMDSDKVIVMSAGQIMEFGHPHELLQKPDGYFTKMLMETGPSMTEQLRNVALNAWDDREVEEDGDLV